MLWQAGHLEFGEADSTLDGFDGVDNRTAVVEKRIGVVLGREQETALTQPAPRRWRRKTDRQRTGPGPLRDQKDEDACSFPWSNRLLDGSGVADWHGFAVFGAADAR